MLVAVLGAAWAVAAARDGSWTAAPIGALALTAAYAVRNGSPLAALRRRWLFGIPWGTLWAVGLILAVYYLVQGGGGGPPASIPFTARSYFDPVGWLVAGFAHAGRGHLLGNLFGTLVYGSLAEWYWGHYPRRRGAVSFGRTLDAPPIRALVIGPAVVVGLGLATALFAWGPVIGFSGVVFAFVGILLVQQPLLAVVAVIARQAVGTLYRGLESPVVTATPGESFTQPWWADTAVQGHLLGLMLGVTIGVALLRQRGDRPSARRLWVGTALTGAGAGLWAVWWFGPGDSFVLYRAAGLALLLLLAGFVTVAVRLATRIGTVRGPYRWRHVGALLLLLPVATMAGIALPTHATAVSADGVDPTVTTHDYRIDYGEDVPVRIQRPVDAIGDDPVGRATASGVIVVNKRRVIWTQAVSKRKLVSSPRQRVVVGGLTWRERIAVQRRGWTPAGNRSVYTVSLHRPEDPPRIAFNSTGSRAAPVIAGRNVTLRADGTGDFRLIVSRNGTAMGRAGVPAPNATTRAGGLHFARDGSRIVARTNDTRMTVATREDS